MRSVFGPTLSLSGFRVCRGEVLRLGWLGGANPGELEELW
jgi:hypothetical protein